MGKIEKSTSNGVGGAGENLILAASMTERNSSETDFSIAAMDVTFLIKCISCLSLSLARSLNKRTPRNSFTQSGHQCVCPWKLAQSADISRHTDERLIALSAGVLLILVSKIKGHSYI